MIISRTPFRISFFGGGTDYPSWFCEEGGAVLSTTVDKYCYISCRYLPPFFETKHRIVWSHIETVSRVSEILHPAVRHGIRYLQLDDSRGLEIHHQGDLPARAGMGSSSAFVVGLLRALLALRGEMISRHDLASRAIELEQVVMKEQVGCQDQVAVAYGGVNYIVFQPSGEFVVERVVTSAGREAELQDSLLLFYTGTSRLSSEVAADMVSRFGQKGTQLRRMREMVEEGVSILCGAGSLDDFGRLLHEGWRLKRELSELISNSLVDHVYSTAMSNGALGGKLLGAGSSGFMLFYVPPERQPQVIKALASYLHVPFRFEHEGSVLLHYTPPETVPSPAEATPGVPGRTLDGPGIAGPDRALRVRP